MDSSTDAADNIEQRPHEEGGQEGDGETSSNEVDVESLGGIGRMFGAMISRFGHIPIPTQISSEVLYAAKSLCQGGCLDGGGAADERVVDLVWGWEFEGRVERQAASFFRITADERQAANGLVVNCRSANKGKFKLLTFDREGSIMHQEDSSISRDGTTSEATLYFTNFETFFLGAPTPDALVEENSPAVFGKLEQFRSSRLSIHKGQHLICVYGDNFIGKTFYNILAVPALNDCEDVKVIQALDQKVLAKKAEMELLHEEYIASRSRYEACLRRLKEETVEVDDLIDNREAAYTNFLEASARAYLPAESTDGEDGGPRSRVAGWVGGLSSSLQGVASAGASVAPLAADLSATASAASGWLSASFSTGIERLNKIIIGTRPESSSSDEDNIKSDQIRESTNGIASAPTIEGPIQVDAAEPIAATTDAGAQPPPRVPGTSEMPSLKI